LYKFIGKEHTQEVLLSRDGVFNFAIEFNKAFPGDVLFKMDIITNTSKILKNYVLNKLKIYTGRMQTSLNLTTQKYLGDCGEPKVHHNLYELMTKIIATPIANILIGEVSIHVVIFIKEKRKELKKFHFHRRNHNVMKL